MQNNVSDPVHPSTLILLKLRGRGGDEPVGNGGLKRVPSGGENVLAAATTYRRQPDSCHTPAPRLLRACIYSHTQMFMIKPVEGEDERCGGRGGVGRGGVISVYGEPGCDKAAH